MHGTFYTRDHEDILHLDGIQIIFIIVEERMRSIPHVL